MVSRACLARWALVAGIVVALAACSLRSFSSRWPGSVLAVALRKKAAYLDPIKALRYD
jgi:hypothetical protein